MRRLRVSLAGVHVGDDWFDIITELIRVRLDFQSRW